MFSLDFLNEIKIQEVEKPISKKTKKSNNNPDPMFMGIRVWKSGQVFPSQKLVDTFSLEYVTKVVSTNEEGNTVMTAPDFLGNGLDIFALSDWTQIDEQTRKNKAILVGISPKVSPKIDLFGSVKYNTDGTPVNTVMDQRASTFGSKSLLPLIESTYGVLPNEEGFIDLEINVNMNLKSKALNGIFMIPKTISRGDDAGKADMVRRENIDVFPMTPAIQPVVTATPPPPTMAMEPAVGSDFDLDSSY